MWRIITNADFIPRVDQNDLTSAAKKEADWTVDDNIKVLVNSKAQLFLLCAFLAGKKVKELMNAQLLKKYGTHYKLITKEQAM